MLMSLSNCNSKWTVFLISVLSAVALSSGQSSTAQTVDSVLFDSFCKRELTPIAFKLCSYATAADLRFNFFGRDVFSVAATGQVMAYYTDANIKYASFTVVPSSGPIVITCSVQLWRDLPAGHVFIVGRSGEPIVDLSQGLIISEGKEPKPKVYNISSTYSAGATIVYQSDNPVYCGWKPLSQLPYLTFKSSSSESNQSDDSIAGVMRSVSSDNTLS